MLHGLIDFAKFIGPCSHNYIIIQNRLSALKIPVFYPFIPHHYHMPWKPLIFFSFYSFAFSKGHTIGIIWRVAFSECLISLSNMQVGFTMPSHDLVAHLFLSLNNIQFSECTPIYPFIYQTHPGCFMFWQSWLKWLL